MISETFIQNILTGIRRWVNRKLESITEVISLYINNLTDRMEDVEAVTNTIDELTYSEEALYTSGIMATGVVTKMGHMIHLYVTSADVMEGWRDMYFRLPYEPDSNYVRVVNDRGIYESGGIHFKVSFTTQTVDNVTYPVLQLNHYVNGQIANWEYGQNISFNVDYITDED